MCEPESTTKYQDENFRPMLRPTAGALHPGFFLMHGTTRPHVVEVCQQFLHNEAMDTIGCPSYSQDLSPIREYLERHVLFDPQTPSCTTNGPAVD